MALPPIPKLSEAAMVQLLAEGRLEFPPVTLCLETREVQLDGSRADGILQAMWNGQRSRFVFECKTRWTPLVIHEAIQQLPAIANKLKGMRPLLVAPYLPEERMHALADAGVSGLDLCGNGVLLDPPRLYVYRSGSKNLYKQSAPIRGVYDSVNTASIVARVFLLRPRFASLSEVLDACHAMMLPTGRRPPLSKSTVSKVVSQLEEDLLIVRKQGALHLKDPVRLLEQLRRHFRVPIDSGRFLGRSDKGAAVSWAALRSRPNLLAVATGRSSAGVHTGLSVPDRLQVYVSSLPDAVDALRVTPTPAFPNVELIETEEQPAYFDARSTADAVWASPIQTYLELAEGSARELDTAKQLSEALVRHARSALSGG